MKLLHQLPLGADRVEHLQQKRAEQPLGCNRRPSSVGVELGELAIERGQNLVDDAADQPQRVRCRNTVLEVDIREQFTTPLVRSAHPCLPPSSTSFRPPESREYMRETKKIEIFVCGVQRGGTTTLYAHLCEHPSLSPARVKEMHFFDDEAVNWAHPNYFALETLFDPGDGQRVRFEATPIYLFWPPSMERLRAYNADAKLITLFRDPFERALSQWRLESMRGNELLPFSTAIREGRDRLKGLSPLAPEQRVYSYIERGLYGEQVSRALQCFPRQQILFLRSSDLYDRHVDTLRQAPFGDVAPKHENLGAGDSAGRGIAAIGSRIYF